MTYSGDIPKRFENASFKDWEQGSAIRTVLDRYLQNFQKYFELGKGPLFLGNSGLGKSRAAASILNAVAQGSNGRYNVSWCPVTQSLNTMLDARDMGNQAIYYRIYRDIASADVVVFDDFTTLRNSPRLKEYFWMFIESRYEDCRPSIFTANFSISNEEDVDEFWHNIATHFSAPFVRRLKELGSELTLIL